MSLVGCYNHIIQVLTIPTTVCRRKREVIGSTKHPEEPDNGLGVATDELGLSVQNSASFSTAGTQTRCSRDYHPDVEPIFARCTI